MSTLIRRFIGWNRRGTAWLEKKFPRFFGAPSYHRRLLGLIGEEIENRQPKTILEVGGIDRPLLERGQDYEYVGIDIDEQENCHQIYDRFIVQSVEDPLPTKSDLIISITLMEHVPNNRAAVASMFDSLREGGGTFHYIPSKWHPYSVALRIIGPKWQRKLIPILRPAAVEVTGYPAFFDHCSPRQMKNLFRTSGFEEVRVEAFYRASDYFAFFVPAYLLVALYENICNLLNLQFACSGFIISARRPS